MKKLNQMDLAILDALTVKPCTLTELNKFYRQDVASNILNLLKAGKIEFKTRKYHKL